MSLIQFVVSPSKKYISKDAEGYILLNEAFVTEDNKAVFGDKYEIVDSHIKEEYVDTVNYIKCLAKKVVGYCGNALNESYMIDLTEREWRYPMYQWAYSFLFDAYDRYNKIVSVKGKTPFVVRKHGNPIMANQLAYGGANIYDPDFASFLYAHLFHSLNLEVRDQEEEDGGRNLSIFARWENRISHLINEPRFLIDRYKKTYKPINGNCKTLVVASRMPKTMEERIAKSCNNDIVFLDKMYFEIRQKKITRRVAIDINRRKQLFCHFRYENEFESLIDGMLISFLPLSLFEAFPKIYSFAKKMSSKWTYKKLYSSGITNELFATCCVLMRRNGSRSIDIQHAASYGINPLFGICEYETWDEFVTWGWTDKKLNYLIRPAAISRVPIKPVTDNGLKKNKILLVTNVPETTNYGSGWLYNDYILEQKEFISKLSQRDRKDLVIRMRAGDIRLCDTLIKWCNEKYPEVKFELASSIPFPVSVMKSRVVVCDYYSSAHLETIMCGKPFLIFEGAKNLYWNDSIYEYIKRLKQKKIICEHGSELAEELSLHEDINEWLGTSDVKRLYEEYLHALTNCNKDIYEIWTNEFCNE